jgi:hypothetical protein
MVSRRLRSLLSVSPRTRASVRYRRHGDAKTLEFGLIDTGRERVARGRDPVFFVLREDLVPTRRRSGEFPAVDDALLPRQKLSIRIVERALTLVERLLKAGWTNRAGCSHRGRVLIVG